jgi:hypothetical protein
MTNVAEIDRLVREDDQMVADLLPQLGPRVRSAYTADRNAWIALRSGPAGGQNTPAATLDKHKRTFAGWARALRAKAGPARATPRAPAVAPANRSAALRSTAAAGPQPASPVAKPGHRGVWLAAALAVVGIIGLGLRRNKS